ncbi:MAG TPA: NAD(P)-dependent oxidoreductase [Cyclobacteriaceae bacterium]|nr:NAD(P)-dependent oxidoreductase [Cyclobacteriaceae bacterium]
MKNKVLITGASGFIGSFLVEEALHQGFEVWAGIRNTSSREYLKDNRIKFVELNLSSEESLKKKIISLVDQHGAFDYVIHNAGITYAPIKKDFIQVNYSYTKNLTNAIRTSGIPLKKFVLISSLAALGPGNSETFEPIKISDTPHPISTYGKSKLMAEQHLRSLHSFPYLIINPTAVYGPRDKDFLGLIKLIRHGFEFYIRGNRQMISLLHVKDLARAVMLAMKSPVRNQSYLISDGFDYDKEQLGEVIKKILGKRTVKYKLPATPLRWAMKGIETIYLLFGKQSFLNVEKVNEISSANWKCNSEEIWRDIRTSPEFTLEKGMEETLDWYKENGWIK